MHRGPVEVAGALAIVPDRDGVDDVVDALRVQAQAGVAPGAEVLDRLDFQLERLRRHQVGIAGIGLVVVEVHRGEEIVEVQLADAALQLHVEVQRRRGLPRHRQQPLGPAESAGQAAATDLLQARIFAAQAQLESQVRAQGATVGRHHFVAILLHRRGAAGERHFVVHAVAAQQEQARNIVEAVEGVFGRQLPVAGPFPAVFGATDALVLLGVLGEAATGGRRAIGKLGLHRGLRGRGGEAI